MTKILNTLFRTFVLGLIVTLASCCEKPGCDIDHSKTRKVLVLYSAGYNSLKNYLQEDIEDLKEGWLPGNECSDDILLVYTHTPPKGGSYNTPSSPYLIKLYRDAEGRAVADTLQKYPEGTISSSASQLNSVLSHIQKSYPAKSYGMVFSSHATGYLPPEYYSKPEKSIGQDQVGSSSYEIELKDFAEAIPMKMDYILFDACLMGGVEVAYELRGKCGKVGFSQAEVLAEGFDYTTITNHLLKNPEPDPKSVCEDYFMQYDTETGVMRSATISLVDCNRMQNLAEVCRSVFSVYREGLNSIDPAEVQRFYRGRYHWFYDLESIIIEAGASDTELDVLHAALKECVLYKAHTPQFMTEFDIKVFSGFSMYLPCNGGEKLDKYYKTLSWNMATHLVE